MISSATQHHSMLTAAAWLNMVGNLQYEIGVGGTPMFVTPARPANYLQQLATVVAHDGSFNGKSRYAERVAICLVNNRNGAEALRLFMAIVEGESDILFVKKPREDQSIYPQKKPRVIDQAYRAKEVADIPGKLGYEGVYRFGVLAFVSDQKELAQRLFLEIVNKMPTGCYPARLQSLRVLSLLILNKMGVTILASGKSIEDELIAAVSHSSGF